MNLLDYIPQFDGLRNLISQIGNPAKSKSHAWTYDFSTSLLTQPEVEAAYTTDWLPRRIVDIVPYHVTREWRTWQADQAETLYETEKGLGIRQKVKQAMIYDRLYGGGVILIGAQTNSPDKPLRLEAIGKGGIKYLHVFHRYELIAGDLITDIESQDFGLPEWYTINNQESLRNVRIDRSRFVFFISMPLPKTTLLNGGLGSDRGWGQSIYDHVIRACIRAEASAENAGVLLEEANVDVITDPDLTSKLATKEGTNKLIARYTMAKTLKGTNGMLLLGGQEKYDRKQIGFGGLPELINTNLQIASGAARIPIVVLLGQTPAGFSTGDSDIRNFYDECKTYQATDLQDCISKLDECIIRHGLGGLPDGVTYEWDPLWQLTQAEAADIGSKKVAAFKTLSDSGLFAPEELRPSVADVLIDDGFLPTLDQHMLDEDQMAELLANQPDPLADPATEDPGAAAGEGKANIGPSPRANLRLVPGTSPRAATGDSLFSDYEEQFDLWKEAQG